MTSVKSNAFETIRVLVGESSNLKRYAKAKLLPQLLQVCFQLLATCIGDGEAEEDAEEDERDVGYSAKTVIEASDSSMTQPLRFSLTRGLLMRVPRIP